MVVGVCGLKRTMRVSGGRAVKGQVAAHPNRAGRMLRKPKKCTKLGRQRGQAEHTHFFYPPALVSTALLLGSWASPCLCWAECSAACDLW